MKKQKTVTALIECPKGYNQKFDYEPQEKRFKLSKILPAGLVFLFDFGMLLGTKGEDGDPLDIIVISESATFPGCLVECRIIGALKAEQTERDGDTVRNDRFIGVPQVSQMFANIQHWNNCRKALLINSKHFLRIITNRPASSSGLPKNYHRCKPQNY
jgi:inorganic pyrophosphatase